MILIFAWIMNWGLQKTAPLVGMVYRYAKQLVILFCNNFDLVLPAQMMTVGISFNIIYMII